MRRKTGKGIFMFKEFKEFALKGNMVDLAIGIVIGAAFGAIVSSLVDDVFMPVIGLIIGGVDFSALMLGPMSIGLFINAVVKFIIIAFVLFLVVKGMNKMKKKEEAAPSAPSREEVLLTEIRDLLKTK
ncbi:large conductance mechanosensitive channel protein MscL [Mariluticola halotolerans]|uniref:large conductance mechanosensitive channel protein MscL n=1 Tax=Mariluticola halotolerans TaxID=2909283 RepID=UPI003F613454